VKLQDVDLREQLLSCMDEIRLGNPDRHELNYRGPESAVPFVTDPNLLHHIITNLLSNAVRYSPAGSPIDLMLTADAQAVQIEVADRGIGIPAEDQQRIFEAFERGGNVGTIQGTGLGLNIVKRMIELLDGEITTRPRDGGGSRFLITLRRKQSSSPNL
jgi:signal transduction histidine kinase